jgi:uncharacterized damage-inducible protein DinB
MTLQEAKLLHAYNSWATERIFQAVATLTPEQVNRDLKSSHGSIYGTLLHLVGGQKIWLSRWVGKPDASVLAASAAPTVESLKKVWEKVGLETAQWLATMSDKRLQDSFTMTTTSGETYRHIFAQAFQHVVDHGTYHRGQIVTMLRQTGVTPPNTGMITFYRETAKLK